MKEIILDGKYELGGGLGCWAKSKERYAQVRKGDVRVIDGVLMYAFSVKQAPWYQLSDIRDEVWWTPVDEKYNTMENLRKFKNK